MTPSAPCGHDVIHNKWKRRGWICPGCRVKSLSKVKVNV